MKRIVSVIMCLGMLAVMFAAGCGMNVDEMLKKADATSDAAEKVKILSEVIKKKPDLVEAYLKRADAYADLKDYDSELEDGKKAVELAPDKAEGYICRGKGFHNKKHYDEALADYNKALEINSEYVRAYRLRGILYVDIGKFDLAMKDYNKALEIKPDDAGVYCSRGYLYNRLGQYQKALEDLNKAVDLNPNYNPSYLNRGISYHNLGNKELAIKDYEKAISLDSRDFLSHYNLGILYEQSGEADKALDEYKSALELNPDFDVAYNNMGIVYANHRQDYERAINEYTKAIELNPTALYYTNRADSYRMSGDYENALLDVEKAITMDGNYLVAKRLKAAIEEAIRIKNTPPLEQVQASGGETSDRSVSRNSGGQMKAAGGPGTWGCKVCGARMDVKDVSIDPESISGPVGECTNFVTQRPTFKPHQWIRIR